MPRYTNRIYLPSGGTIYTSDDKAGYNRMAEIYKGHGDLKVEFCEKIWGQSLDDSPVMDSTTITETLGIA